MTPVITPYRSSVHAGHGGFFRVLRAEWTKFRTVRGWMIGMLVAGILTVLVGMIGAAGNSGSCGVSDCSIPVGPGGQQVTDQFFFVHKQLDRDASITTAVTSLTGLIPSFEGRGLNMRPGLHPWAKAGIIIKESTRQGSAYAAIMVTGSHGVRMQDDYTRDTAGLAGPGPRWLRLVRSGNVITGYDSADGAHWNAVGTVRLPGLTSTVLAGLFVAAPQYTKASSHFILARGATGPSQATAVFDQVSVEGSQSGEWRGDEVGAGGGAPGPSVGYEQAGNRFTVSGFGDIAPALGGTIADGLTVENFLVGAFAGLIAVIVVGTMFITAEYRRGLIRTTLIASPRRGRVLLAKALVLGSVTFVIGLAASVAVVAIDKRITQANGAVVIPVSSSTELREVVGTAGLLAVTAVLALALGAIARRGAAAVTAVVVAIVLPYILATSSVLPIGATEWLMRVTPAAAFAIQQSIPRYPQVDALYTPSLGYYPLAPWAGFAVLCGWTVLAMGLAIVLLRRQDA